MGDEPNRCKARGNRRNFLGSPTKWNWTVLWEQKQADFIRLTKGGLSGKMLQQVFGGEDHGPCEAFVKWFLQFGGEALEIDAVQPDDPGKIGVQFPLEAS